MSEALVRVVGATKHFPLRGGFMTRQKGVIHALDDVSLDVASGETLGLVGETGCGKSTLARAIVGLHPLTAGHIEFEGRDIATFSKSELRLFRRSVQMVFQDPYGSLNPRRRVGAIIADPLAIHDIARGAERRRRVQSLMERVGLNPEHYNRFPAEFSGGQRQRIGIARALAVEPRLIVCDEPVSALDVSIQAQIINLLKDLQRDLALTYVFISHDLGVIEHVSDRVAVMYLGRIAESGDADAIFAQARHPYTAALLSATMAPNPEASERRGAVVLTGDVPSPISPPDGCRFHPRCPRAVELCATNVPMLEPRLDDPPTHAAACHVPLHDGEHLVSIPLTIAPSLPEASA